MTRIDQIKESNPKDVLGVRRAPVSIIPCETIYELGLALLEGALKYGRHNWRAAGVRASVYFDAMSRHKDKWWEGNNFDPSSAHELAHVMACCAIIIDAERAGKLYDDRPPRILAPNWLDAYNTRVEALLDKYPNAAPPYTEQDHGKDRTGR